MYLFCQSSYSALSSARYWITWRPPTSSRYYSPVFERVTRQKAPCSACCLISSMLSTVEMWLLWYYWIYQLHLTRSTTIYIVYKRHSEALTSHIGGFSPTCLVWRSMYAIGANKSSATWLMCGVPQGSVLVPILFVMYTVDLIPLIQRHGLSAHLYADDTHVYGSCRPADVVSFSSSLSSCVDETSDWMKSNWLQPSPDKAEVLWCTTSRRQHKILITSLLIDGAAVDPAKSVRDLGIYIDADLVMRAHVQRTVSRCFAALYFSCVRSVVQYHQTCSSHWL